MMENCVHVACLVSLKDHGDPVRSTGSAKNPRTCKAGWLSPPASQFDEGIWDISKQFSGQLKYVGLLAIRCLDFFFNWWYWFWDNIFWWRLKRPRVHCQRSFASSLPRSFFWTATRFWQSLNFQGGAGIFYPLTNVALRYILFEALQLLNLV